MEDFNFRIPDQIYVKLNVTQITNDYQENKQYELKLQTYQQSYLLDKEYFNYFIKQNHVINDDINFNKVNIEFYDFQNEEFINQDDDIIEGNHQFYIFPSEFLKNKQKMKIKISPAQMNKFDRLQSTIREIDDFQFQQKNLLEKINQITQDNNIISENLDNIKQYVLQKGKENVKPEKNNEKMVIIYSNPILQQSSNKEYEPANFIDYETEINQILESQKHSQASIDIKFYQATKDNLIKVIKQQPSIIHIIANGDYDLNKAQYYLEFNEKGLVDRLYLQNFFKILQKILQDNEKHLLQIKLICISSNIGIKIAKMIKQVNQNLPIISAQRVWNNENDPALEFWKQIYTQIFFNLIITKDIINQIKNILEEKQKGSNMCCCFHEHTQECLQNYQNIGYQQFHEEHQEICFHICPTKEQEQYLSKLRLNKIKQLQPLKQLTDQDEENIKINAFKYLCCCQFYEFYLKPLNPKEIITTHKFHQKIYAENLERFQLKFKYSQQKQINDNRNFRHQIIFIYQNSESNIQSKSESIFEVVIKHFKKNQDKIYIPIIDINNVNGISIFLQPFNKQKPSKITDDMFKNETINKDIMKLIQNDNSNDDKIILIEITNTIQKKLFQEKGESNAFLFLEYF